MRAVLAIAAVELRRFLRDRSNIFFVFIFPLLLVLVLGAQFGSSGTQGTVTITGGQSELRTAVVSALEDDDVAVSLADADAMRTQVARGRTGVGIVIPPAAAEAFADGRDVEIEVIAGAQQGAQLTLQRVRAAAASVSAEQGQLAALTAVGAGEDEATAALAAVREELEPPRLEVVNTSEIAQEFSGLGQFDLGASGQTLLFVFLASAAGSATLIQGRRLGVLSRTLAAPVSSTHALGGQALGRFVIAAFQGVYIMGATALFFGVSWGNIWLSGLVLLTFSVVAAGAAMLIGSVLDNDGAANGVGVGLGLTLAALGGCMMPLEFFGDTMRAVAHVTPHAWAYEAFGEIQRHDASLVDILPQLGVLAAMAAVLLGLGSWALRRSVARAM
ncbi:ABC transporter permease [Georgenia sp. MJ206]|uniref:ABC transporter permease n=1 Tax=Georgenia wangjunii TaxID=3117730 RepID=UPI002F2638BD